MGRPPRPVGANVTYHLMSRGNRAAPIFHTDGDREMFLRILAKVCARCEWTCLAYCLMGNHFHVAVTTRHPNLPNGMAQLVGHYARNHNREHGLSDHVFGRRYHEVVVDSDAHLLTLIRYISRNPVRAGLVERAEDWPWASYPSLLGLAEPAPFFPAPLVLDYFDKDPQRARTALRLLVEDGWASDDPPEAAARPDTLVA